MLRRRILVLVVTARRDPLHLALQHRQAECGDLARLRGKDKGQVAHEDDLLAAADRSEQLEQAEEALVEDALS